MPKPRPSNETLPDSVWQLELSNALQTTLDVEELVHLFSKRSTSVVPHDSVEFRTHDASVLVRTSDAAEYACSFNLALGGKNLGTLVCTRDYPFTDWDMKALNTVLWSFVHPLRNALLYSEALRAATKDPLTGVNNRTTLNTILERDVILAHRHGYPLAVIMVDVDRFKAINDTYGHLVGDCVLKKLADCLTVSLRESDVVFRYGGEEFVVVLSNTQLEGALFLARRIRKAVEHLDVQCEDITLNLTISAGVAGLGKDDDAYDLLERADQAMYRSKAEGRNRVTALAPPGLASGSSQ